MQTKKRRELIKYIVLAILVFLVSTFLGTAMFWVVSILIGKPDMTDGISVIPGWIEGFIAALATSLVFYQLKIGNDAEKQQSNIDEASFISQYNQMFIQDEHMCDVEKKLEAAMNGTIRGPIIEGCNKQFFINYLVYLESLAPLMLRDVLKLSHVDDLLAYRFFLVVHNKEMQKELTEYPEYYRGCFKLHKKWVEYRNDNGLEILQNENSLSRWPYYSAFCNPDVVVRPMRFQVNQSPASASKNNRKNKRKGQKYDDVKKIAELIYRTDEFIYPALFGSLARAKKQLPKMMKAECIFHHENIHVAELNGKIVGVAVTLKEGPKDEIDTSLIYGASGKDVCEKYFNQYSNISDDECHILCLSVDPKQQGKGIGKTLLASVMYQNREKNIKLSVLADNKEAHGLYRKLGFIDDTEGSVEEGYAYRKPEKPKIFNMTFQKRPNL